MSEQISQDGIELKTPPPLPAKLGLAEVAPSPQAKAVPKPAKSKPKLGGTRPAPEPLKFPESALVGSCGELARVLSAGTEVPPEFVFASALTLLGSLACQGRLELDIGGHVDPRVFTVLLGASGDVKKSTAIKKAVEFFQSIHPPQRSQFRTVNGVASAEGLVRELTDFSYVVLVFDEFRSFLDKCKIQGSALLSAVASLFEGGDWDNATKNPKHSACLRGAKLSLLAACTTETWESVWGRDAISIGLPNRLLVVCADARPRVAWPQSPDLAQEAGVRHRIEAQLARLPMKLRITADARTLWERWYHSLPGSEHAKRLDTIGFRIMMLMALSMDKAEVDADVVQVVTDILNYELRVRMMTDPVDADSVVAGLEEKIRRAVDTLGQITKRDLRRKISADRAGIWAFDKALDNLTRAEDIQIDGSLILPGPSASASAPAKADLSPG
jgi:hypothetical protein